MSNQNDYFSSNYPAEQENSDAYYEKYFSSNNHGMQYDIDIVFVVDATGSMAMGNVIKTVKDMIPRFYKEAKNALEKKHKHVETMRVKVIFFRDFLEYEKDNRAPLMETDFFTLSDTDADQSEMLSNAIKSIEAMGGGDIPEDGLEALASAMQSKWCQETPEHRCKRRHIIALFTDAPTHELGYGRSSTQYPKNMPKDFGELIYLWGNQEQNPGTMDYFAKRLILFIPEVAKLPADDGWRRIVKGKKDAFGEDEEKPWENLYLTELDPLKNNYIELNFNKIMDCIVNSV